MLSREKRAAFEIAMCSLERIINIFHAAVKLDAPLHEYLRVAFEAFDPCETILNNLSGKD